MVDQEIRNQIAEYSENAAVFDDPAFDNSIIGVSADGAAVYDYNEMIEELMIDEGWSGPDAIDWIEFNTMRSIPYASSITGDKDAVPPIVVYRIMRSEKTQKNKEEDN